MKRVQTLAILLAVMLSLAACGGSGAQQSDSPDGQRTEPTTEETNPDGAATEETTVEDDAAQEPEQDNRSGGEAAGTSVTTLDGERVSVGGGGEATALFFMAGW